MTLYPRWDDSIDTILSEEGFSDDIQGALWSPAGLDELRIFPEGSIVENLSPWEARGILGDLAA